MKAVILAGGSGSRLWPVSTDKLPKQFHSLVSNKTLLQETYNRLNFLKPEDIYVATNKDYVDLVKEQIANIQDDHIIAEPGMRDTAPCIGYAATILAKKTSENEVMCIIYADHLIQDTKEFQKKLKIAADQAKKEKTLNIIEVKAKFPNVNLGYVKIDKLDKTIDDVQIYKFAGFREKPDLETAKKFVNSFNYLWNTGYYVWRIDSILSEFKKHAPDLYSKLMKIKEGLGTDNEKQITKEHYNACNKISIDFAIMEKVNHNNVRIIPADLGWSDIGTWESLYKELPKNKDGNVEKGGFIKDNCKNSLLYNYENGKKIAVIDLEDIAVINTKDGLIICPRKSSHKVKDIVKKHLK
ncbi:NTP transferase domain-containing protein [Patescibacteria group bacterium]|nr:NTP transferase domain-containing protein [Patescibacteria group bacterium]